MPRLGRHHAEAAVAHTREIRKTNLQGGAHGKVQKGLETRRSPVSDEFATELFTLDMGLGSTFAPARAAAPPAVARRS